MTYQVEDLKIGGLVLPLKYNERVFKPNPVTRYLGDASNVQPGSVVFDLGCGVGPLGVFAGKKGARRVCSSDIMPEACDIARINVADYGLSNVVEVRQGSLFEPWNGEKADLIIDDVAGMAERLGRKTGAYKFAGIPTGGPRGSDNSLAVIRQAKSHLNTGGRLLLPVIGLSDYNAIINAAREELGKLRTVLEKQLVLSEAETAEAAGVLEELATEGWIKFEMRGRRCTFPLWIFEYQHPN